MKNFVLFILTILTFESFAQVSFIDTTSNSAANSAANILANKDKKLQIGSYAQIDFNQQFGDTVSHNGKLDVHRFVLFFGYHFNDRTTFVTEIEAEHVKEWTVEQAFVNYNINPAINFRAGLLLIPMGIVNEYHEPTTFNGVERPNADKYIIPSTWREIGAGFAGNIEAASLRYQLYVVNGFNGYNGAGVFKGSSGLRKGRQKGAESFMSSPVASGKLDYYGINGLKVGLAGYFGNSQSTALDGVNTNASMEKSMADSTYVGISMVGLDYRYNYKAITTRGQLIYAALNNTDKYNNHTGGDLGSSLLGYYIEAGYNLLAPFNLKREQKLDAFVRYENYNTHYSVSPELTKNLGYDRTDITMGLSYHIAKGVVLKGDYQLMLDKANGQKNMLNFGVGTWF
ncbi:hypothetical protein N9R81_03400 [Flavobacteriales bacterium]|nr:hypothetical protein [Flavobacteriales bacterium]